MKPLAGQACEHESKPLTTGRKRELVRRWSSKFTATLHVEKLVYRGIAGYYERRIGNNNLVSTFPKRTLVLQFKLLICNLVLVFVLGTSSPKIPNKIRLCVPVKILPNLTWLSNIHVQVCQS